MMQWIREFQKIQIQFNVAVAELVRRQSAKLFYAGSIPVGNSKKLDIGSWLCYPDPVTKMRKEI